MTTQQHSPPSSRAGLTLVELLITIAVIAVIIAAAIPSFTGVTDGAVSNSAKRTAQIVASTAENARIAGNAAIANAKNAQDVIDLLDSGVEGEGVFEGVVFKIRLNDDQRVNVLPYLKFDAEGLTYAPNAID